MFLCYNNGSSGAWQLFLSPCSWRSIKQSVFKDALKLISVSWEAFLTAWPLQSSHDRLTAAWGGDEEEERLLLSVQLTG